MSDAMEPERPNDPAATPVQGDGLVRAGVAGTAVFVAVIAVGLPLRDERPAQILVGVTSMVLFAVGAVGCLWAYVSALERSRTDEIGVANLFLLTGATAPPRVKRTLLGALVVQVVVSLVAAFVGAAGLTGNQVNAMAFGILVPMYGLAIDALWAVRHGTFGPRLERRVRSGRGRID